MSHSPDTRCYGSVGVGPDDRFYTGCDDCGWRGAVYEADQHDAARREADGHSDPEVLKEMADWMALNSPPDSPFPYLEDPIEDTNS
jgi:predicted  nucleic acid-binding Zn-ribbon protein